MTTLAQYRSRVSAKLGLDTTASGTDEVLVDSWINEAVTDFLLQTRCKVVSATTTLAADEEDFTLDTDILTIIDAYVDGSTADYAMTQVLAHELLAMRRATSTTATGPLYYAVAGSNLLMVYPTPAATTTLKIYYLPRPITLSTGSASPDEIPVEFHKAVEFFALAEGADYDDDQSSAQGQRYREEYDRWVMKARKYLNRKGNVRLPLIAVGPTQTGQLSRSQDVSPW